MVFSQPLGLEEIYYAKLTSESFITIGAHVDEKNIKKIVFCMCSSCQKATICKVSITVPVFSNMKALQTKSFHRTMDICTNFIYTT